MNNPSLLILIAIIIGLSILMINISVNFAMARRAHGVGHAALSPLIQEQVYTGNPKLDKQINKFYHCISKTHEDPPSIQTADKCYNQGPGGYNQNSIGGISGSGNANNNHDNNGATHSTAASALVTNIVKSSSLQEQNLPIQ